MAGVEDPPDHSRHGRFAAGPADCNAALSRVQQPSQEFGTGEVLEIKLLRANHIGNRRLDCRRGYQGHTLLKPRSVLRKQLDSQRAEIVELLRSASCVERAVRSRDPDAASAHDGSEREHPAAADAAEENGRIDHRRGPIGVSRGRQAVGGSPNRESGSSLSQMRKSVS